MMRIVIGLAVLLSCAWVHASPLVHFKLEGRRNGTSDPFASSVEVSLGDVVEYRLRLRMASPGSTNRFLSPLIEYGQDHKHGMSSLSIAVVQATNDPIQVDLSSPAELARGWDRGTGAQGGVPSLRPGSSWNDLLEIRPILGPGEFTGSTEVTVFGGLLNVAAIAGSSGQVRAEWSAWSGAGWFEGRLFFVLPLKYDGSTEAGLDPLTQFAPLTLTAADTTPNPEPSTVVLATTALAILLLLRRRVARAR